MDSLTAIQSVSSVPESLQITSLDNVEKMPPTKTSFASMIGEGVNNVNTNLQTAEASMSAFALDGNMPTHELMLTMEKAKFSLQVAVEVRNRLVEAYSEITRMQI
jgi:flagellar hook-basal body complex protein FliE